ncbi:TetR/AcrR family transcriptional regulator [Aminobacter sp. J44]|uniref:TetR/AcrR family transcriptional regulator n=1 Tax=Aminobacter sp. J44 TaxID=935262 RepID=UPI00119C3DF7|nr:TetR/AcrR family transcriptional regulator [Aminobacter sp. J44]TWG49535.1 TetR family transcriptional regulator [Aminobacter sp. J44]
MSQSVREQVTLFKRMRILEEAVELFFERGYDGTRVDMIADRLGVTKPYIYYHFKNKGEILDEIALQVTTSSLEPLRSAVASDAPIAERLTTSLRELALGALRRHAWIAIYFREEKYISNEARKQITADRRNFDALLMGLLREAHDADVIGAVDLSIATQVLTGMVTWSFAWYRPRGRLSEDQIADELTSLCLNAIRMRI